MMSGMCFIFSKVKIKNMTIPELCEVFKKKFKDNNLRTVILILK